jgi:K+-transporting ATPase KdpA subunit
MNANAVTQLVIYFGVLLAIAKPLGEYMARVYEGRSCGLDVFVGPVERLVYRLSGIRPDREMAWREYGVCLLVFNLIGLLAAYVLQRFQHVLPLNPQSLPAVSPELAMNTAISFATNTNWQSYSGETTLSYLTQMLGLTVQNFLSAATGMAVLAALVRGFARQNGSTIGNAWCDVTRGTLYILLPLSLILALLLVSQGVVQTFRPYQAVALAQPTTNSDGHRVTEQVIALGPAASQVSIKQLGTNGGGFFNANSAHPLENPTPLSGFLESLAILLIPASLCFTFGRMVRDPRQGWAVLAAMLIVFVPLLAVCLAAEQGGTPGLSQPGIDCSCGDDRAGGNMEGKETRFGITQSALWVAATTAASNGSVNAMHDSCTSAGGLVAMWLMQLGEVIFGGVGSGLTTWLCVFPLNGAAGESRWFDIGITLWLWFTVLFANFAEAMAEGRGKAQADALRRARTQVIGKRLRTAERADDCSSFQIAMEKTWDSVPASGLRAGDVVLLEAGDYMPADGEVIEGIASVDESAVTGESAPVIREGGGDRSGVTGGTRVLSDWLVVRITANPGEAFLDRMIAMVEGARRKKTRNEIALDILLAAMTIVFLLVCATLPPMSQYSIHAAGRGSSISITVLVALLVCLIPTTIGGLLSAIGIAGMDRMIQANVIATSGRAVEAAGDVNVLLLDKTGTITLGNRQAVEFVTADGVAPERLADAA